MSDEETLPCRTCGGETVRGILIDRDDERDEQACFALLGDRKGYLTPTYPGQMPVTSVACIRCGRLDHYVQPLQLRERLRTLGRLPDEEV